MPRTNNERLSKERYDEILWEESKGCAAFASGKARQLMTSDQASQLPRGTHRWELSWAGQENMMRIRHPESGMEWLFNEAVGHIHVTGCNDVTHRMNMYGQLKLEGGILYAFRPPKMAIPKLPSGMHTTYLPKAMYRLCANINEDVWRLRNEGTNQLTHVQGFYGSLHWNYLDKGSHIFHVDDMVLERVDSETVIGHFIDSDLDWEYAPLGTA